MIEYDTWDEMAMAHNETVDELKQRYYGMGYKYRIGKRILEIERKEKEMAKTATITKRENAPEFVFGSFGYKLEDLKDYVNEKGYVNFDILKGKEGGYYVKISDYGLNKKPAADDEAIPF